MSSIPRNNEHALSFGRAADDYERGRPTYPVDAVRWILSVADRIASEATTDTQANRSLDILDVGAGTGKFTAVLLAAEPDRIVRVSAVEPDPEMRLRLSAALPEISAIAGTGELLPVADNSVDLVSFAQAWHWVDPVVTGREVSRVLRDDGLLALVWNIRDDSVDWVAELGEIMGASAAEQYSSEHPVIGDDLTRADYAEFRWVATITRDKFFAMVTSRSYVITMAAAERAAMLGRLAQLLDTHPALAGKIEYPMPYVTRVTIARPIRQASTSR